MSKYKDYYNLIKQEYLIGTSVYKLQSKYNIDRHTICKWLKANKIILRKNPCKKYQHFETFFDFIDTECKAYWLGFLMADGAVSLDGKHNGLSLCLSVLDEQHLIKFRNTVSPKNKVYRIKDRIRDSKTFSYCRMDIWSTPLAKQLTKLGCGSKKSAVLKFPSNAILPLNLTHHFIRGYFDGDGSVSTLYNNRLINISITGTPSLLNGIQDRLAKQIKEYKISKAYKEHNTEVVVKLVRGGALIVKSIYDYLYKDATIYLERKKEKFVNFYAGRARNGSKFIAENNGNPGMGIRPEGLIDYSI
jgi:hypothetical protein